MNGSLNRNYRMPSLLRGKQLLSEIAFASGFVDQGHMTRIFSRRIGMTPGEWRRRHTEHSNAVRSDEVRPSAVERRCE
jgi:AraC-like DNA-binding protein